MSTRKVTLTGINECDSNKPATPEHTPDTIENMLPNAALAIPAACGNIPSVFANVSVKITPPHMNNSTAGTVAVARFMGRKLPDTIHSIEITKADIRKLFVIVVIFDLGKRLMDHKI